MTQVNSNTMQTWIIPINNAHIIDITLVIVIAQWDPFDRFDMDQPTFWNTRHSFWDVAMPLS